MSTGSKMRIKKLLTFLGGSGVLLSAQTLWACDFPTHSHLILSIANLTGYPLTVDASGGIPSGEGSGAAPFTVSATPGQNTAWVEGVSIISCWEPVPSSASGVIKFTFPSADQGEAGGALGPVSFSLGYDVRWDSNYQGAYPEIKSLAITQNIFNTVPGVSPLSGVATIYQDSKSPDTAYFNIVFYDLAPGVAGNQNVLRPFDPFFTN
jgi:hypothetical protein